MVVVVVVMVVVVTLVIVVMVVVVILVMVEMVMVMVMVMVVVVEVMVVMVMVEEEDALPSLPIAEDLMFLAEGNWCHRAGLEDAPGTRWGCTVGAGSHQWGAESANAPWGGWHV